MRMVFVFLFVVPAALAAACRSPEVGWTRQFGTSGHDVAERVAADSRGNVYVAGWTTDVLPGQANAGGYSDAFLRKFAASGRALWTRQFGTEDIDKVSGVAVDGHGDVYVFGSTSGALDGQLWAGEEDVFLRKFAPSGEVLWTRQFGSDQLERPSGVVVDRRDNVYAAGFTLGAMAGQDQDEEGDIFLRKYDPSGKELWTRQFGSETYDEAFALAVDGRGDIYLSGTTRLTLPGQPAVQPIDAVLFKLDADGHKIWTRQFGSSEADQARGVAVDEKGTVRVAGWTSGAFPGKQSSGMTDAFVNTYGPDGIELASVQFGPVSYSSVACIAIDAGGNPYLSTAMLDPMAERAALGGDFKIGDAPGSMEAFSQASCVSLDRGGNVYVVGWVLGALVGQTSAGEGDAFVVKSTP